MSALPTTSARPRLPREARDTLLVLTAVALVLLPQLAYLPIWASALAWLLLGWRAWLAWQGGALPQRWLLVGLVVVALGATAAQFHTIVGMEAGVVLVVLLLVLKTLEMRARRDAMVIFFLGFFALLTLFLQSQSLPMALAMVLAVWGLLAALVNAHLPAGYPSIGHLLRKAGWLMLTGVPVMVVLFVSFPRFPPLWGLPVQDERARTGLSNDLTVGNVAQLAQDPRIAMRVRFLDGAAPPQRLLYFRGPVLSHFDGRQWKAAEALLPWRSTEQRLPDVRALAPSIAYEITLEPHQQQWLLPLEATINAPTIDQRGLHPSHDLQWRIRRPITEVLRYRAEAALHYAYGEHWQPHQLRPFLQLPADLNPQTRAWAQQLRAAHGGDDMAIIRAALEQLRTGGFIYTLNPDVVTSPHTADAFWFTHKNGFCEHIASAFTVLMRSAGIPARLVTGYQGGAPNPVDGLWTVRQSDAHAWTEVWLTNEGWIRIDPTSAVSPERTEAMLRLQPPDSLLQTAVQGMLGARALASLRANWEAMNHRWNDWVLGYTALQQQATLSRLGLQHWNAPKMAWTAASVLLLALLLAGGHHWWRQHHIDPWQRLLTQAKQQLRKRGLQVPPHHSPRALAQAVQAQWGDESLAVQQWLLQMEQWRYAPQSEHAMGLQQLRHAFKALKWPRSP